MSRDLLLYGCVSDTVLYAVRKDFEQKRASGFAGLNKLPLAHLASLNTWEGVAVIAKNTHPLYGEQGKTTRFSVVVNMDGLPKIFRLHHRILELIKRYEEQIGKGHLDFIPDDFNVVMANSPQVILSHQAALTAPVWEVSCIKAGNAQQRQLFLQLALEAIGFLNPRYQPKSEQLEPLLIEHRLPINEIEARR